MADTTGKLVTQTPNQSTDPAPNFEQFEDWSQWTDALAKWVLEQVRKGEMSAGRLSCVFDVVEFQAKQLLQIKYLHSSDAGPVEGISAEQFLAKQSWGYKYSHLTHDYVLNGREIIKLLEAYAGELRKERDALKSFWVIERFENNNSAGYWDGGSSRDFVKDIDKAIQFRRRDDARWCIHGWHWKDVKLTEHLYLANGAATPVDELLHDRNRLETECRQFNGALNQALHSLETVTERAERAESALAECRNKTQFALEHAIGRDHPYTAWCDGCIAATKALLALKGERQELVDTKEKK